MIFDLFKKKKPERVISPKPAPKPGPVHSLFGDLPMLPEELLAVAKEKEND